MTKKMLIIILLISFAFSSKIILAQSDQDLSITIDSYIGYPQVTLENSVHKIVIRAGNGGATGIEHAIRDWIIKTSNNADIVNDYIDATAQRGPCTSATITNNGTDEKTVRLNYFYSDDYNDYNGIVDYTIFANSPIIKVDYVQYDYSGGWANHVDRTIINNGEHAVCGQDSYGPFVYYPNKYWDAGNDGTDPIDGGALNFREHMIMAYGQTGSTGYGYGRIMPVYYFNQPGKTNQGGIRIMNLLSSIRGFEVFSAAGQGYKPSFTGFLFSFSEGIDNAISLGENIVDAKVDGTPLPLPVELTSFTANIINRKAELKWETATELNNYGFEIERKLVNNDWSVIGFLEGYGNSNQPKYYRFLDHDNLTGNISYRLKQIDNDGTFEYSKIVNIDLGKPNSFKLGQNYPNPFNPSTKIRYNLSSESKFTLTIYNSIGQKISELLNTTKAAGSYDLEFNASNLASGTYLYILSGSSIKDGEEFRIIKKMSIIK
jgi:hypothetical protein